MTPLADFDETIRRLAAVTRTDAIARAYFENVTLRREPGFARRLLRGTPAVFDFPFSNCPNLIAVRVSRTMAALCRPRSPPVPEPLSPAAPWSAASRRSRYIPLMAAAVSPPSTPALAPTAAFTAVAPPPKASTGSDGCLMPVRGERPLSALTWHRVTSATLVSVKASHPDHSVVQDFTSDQRSLHSISAQWYVVGPNLSGSQRAKLPCETGGFA
jgi:hypothetical protein